MNETTHCPACRAPLTDAALLKTQEPYELRLCGRCGLRYSHPMLHPGRDWYEASDIYEEVEWNVATPRKHARRWEFRLFFRQGFPRDAFVFDVGCGRGDFLALARTEGYRVGGSDLNQRLIDVAGRVYGLTGLLPKDLGAISPADLPARPDVITAFEVMEHLPDPAGFLRLCHGLLDKEGAVVISVPGYDRRPHWVQSTVDAPPHHLTLWTEKSLGSILQGCGFGSVFVARKPLLVSDIMYHAVRAVPGALAPGFLAKGLRGACKVASAAFVAAYRFRSSAGGFTLAAVARKK